ncbi:halocyanin domain-containing protein [Halobacterium bonnevillei]|uniref:Halocyanin domain-containing protein n=1 Tax=Halobacterium bonnevillei TaxID=2692200 RepID=A0A6B0SJB6_9EURY|nr:halocyanin domain-containing protein [Halobacterium bonnevillei]MXR21914.1 halocyanin domain-containing protein [Halobacterium bonnevillei]
MRDAIADETYSRRGVLRATAGTAAAAALGSAATGSAAGQTDFDGWFTDDAPGGTTDNYDGEVVDRTGEDEVTVTVGADGNGGTFAFEPAAVRISPGTTVTFEWVSDTHNVAVESQPDDAGWEGHDPIENSGFSFSSTFETLGVYKYYCDPHLSVGMKGAIVVAEGGGEQEDAVPAEYGDWFTDDAPGGAVDNYDGETVDRTGEDEVTVTVGADGNGGTFAFDPPALRVSPGTTVTFEWVSDTHNVVVESQPEDAAWEGHEPIENTGFSFSATLDTRGVYKYYCEPHLSVGMKAAIVVGPAPAEDGGGGPAGTTTPFSPLLGTVFAGAVAAAMLLPVLAGYYRRDQPETPEYDDGVEGEPGAGTQEAPVEEPVEELDHDEYDPMGTAALVAVYFLILVAMWVFMYFVEFLGNELTVIG